MLKKIKCVEVTNVVLPSKPADGTYAVISYDGSRQMTRYGFTVDRVFPWWTSIYVFKDGLCDEVASGSSAAHTLDKFQVEVVYLVDVPAYKRAELDKQLAGFNIELIADEVVQAAIAAGALHADYVEGDVHSRHL